MRVAVRQRFGRAADWVKAIYKEFTSEHASITAGAIALFGMLSLFPLILLAIGVAGYALGDPAQAVAAIRGVVGRVLVGDAAGTLTATIEGVVRSRGLAGFFGLLGFLWAASRIFTIVMEGFNMAWDVDESRSFIHRNLLAIGMVLLTFVFGIVSFLGPLAVGLLLRYSDSLAEQVGISVDTGWVWSTLTSLVAYIVTIGVFFVFYKVLPARPVHWQSALVGAIVAGTLWEVVKYLFQLYLVNFSSYNEVYGALAGVIVLILWLYYSAMILLLGVVASAVYSARVFGDRAEERQHRGFDEHEQRMAA